jgi:polysaccharide export outer membrane protein
MPLLLRSPTCCLLFVLAATGCSSLGDTLSPPNRLLKEAKDIRDTAPVPAPTGRELARELLPPHIIQQGDSLLVQPVDLDSPIRLPPDQMVQPDGTIDLGKYGRPLVVGKTLSQLEEQISGIIKGKEKDKDKETGAITVRLVGKPNAVFYVFGEVNAPGSFPVTGRETVLDGIVAAGGLTKKASKENIILSRPTVPESCRVVLPVCWPQIVQLGDTTTNYQLLPGDRIFVPGQDTKETLFPDCHKKACSACTQPQIGCNGMNGPGCPAPAPVVPLTLPLDHALPSNAPRVMP